MCGAEEEWDWGFCPAMACISFAACVLARRLKGEDVKKYSRRVSVWKQPFTPAGERVLSCLTLVAVALWPQETWWMSPPGWSVWSFRHGLPVKARVTRKRAVLRTQCSLPHWLLCCFTAKTP